MILSIISLAVSFSWGLAALSAFIIEGAELGLIALAVSLGFFVLGLILLAGRRAGN